MEPASCLLLFLLLSDRTHVTPSPTPLNTPHNTTTQTPDTYTLTPAEIAAYKRDGYLRLPGFLTDAEVGAIEGAYDKIMRGEVAVPGKDFCDMVWQWVVRCCGLGGIA